MSFYLVLIAVLFFGGSRISIKGFNEKYIDKDKTSMVKGVFILLIFFSHSMQYVQYTDKWSNLMNSFTLFMGQLVVTMFLFYSGYGVFESYTQKGDDYIDNFPRKRILGTLINFDIAVFLYLSIFICFNRMIPIKQTILSLIGWESLGNSNWYIFDILLLYVISYACFRLFKNPKVVIVFSWVLSILFILFLELYKEPWWYSTILCYPFGMTYSYCRMAINDSLRKPLNYIICFIIVLVSFFVLYKYSSVNFYYELYAVVFCVFVLLITMKIELKNCVLKWLGDNLFWVYILQRIPMIIISHYWSLNAYLFFVIVVVSTVVLTIVVRFIYDKIIKLLFEKTH